MKKTELLKSKVKSTASKNTENKLIYGFECLSDFFLMGISSKVLFFVQEEAETSGDQTRLAKVNHELEELEERATELDRRRTSNINSIRLRLSILTFNTN